MHDPGGPADSGVGSAAGLQQVGRLRADKAAQQALGELEQTLTQTIEDKTKDDTLVLQPELDPEQAMTEVELDGWNYIGYLSIPSVGCSCP